MNERAFIAAIVADPDDDAPRLIYSDWLDEQGQSERAEFIRVQCTLWQAQDLPEDLVDTAKEEEFRSREQQFLDGGLSSALGAENLRKYKPVWRRGFVHAITLSAADWLQHADAILAAQPVQEVTLTTWPMINQIGGIPRFGYDFQSNARYLLSLRWPQIKEDKWHLPPGR
jgi:uncharacterized protein (TIGR02996 family)